MSDELPEDWTDEQLAVFGKVLRFMLSNQSLHCHPDMPNVDPEHWQTICHNSAFLAASIVGGEELIIHDTDTELVLATTESVSLNS